ncbi:MAG: tRNA (adenosine(37)-N6)-threonylcarbamoyltransferase complex dimerization subunit type 1 TsaB [Clostridia bacterium]|nr:tRNA (adenosine(37)-N6)-threonylcarbamoyltransferase complex dimerization subunit type 1 TsaB [Clostridia bacterium]
MKILALNTAFSNSDVAFVYEQNKAYSSFESCAKHSENILVVIDDLCKTNNVKIQHFQTLACVVGPGSFTGVRIGVGVVKGMHMANKNLKLISMCSLDYMAYIAKQSAKDCFWCVLNALSGNVFACKYSISGERLTEPKMLLPNEIQTLCGDVVGLKEEAMELCTRFVEFNANNLLEYAMHLEQTNCFVSESNLLPIYLRKSQAEVMLDGN